MKKTCASLTVLGLLLLLVAAAAPQAEKPGGIFAALEKGSKVALKETAQGFEIGVFPGVELAFTVKEVGQDYIVVEDITGITETRIPIYSVKCVRITRLPKK